MLAVPGPVLGSLCMVTSTLTRFFRGRPIPLSFAGSNGIKKLYLLLSSPPPHLEGGVMGPK